MQFDDVKIRDKESFAFAKEIRKPFGAIDQIISWCRTELTGDWRWQLVQASSDIAPGRYIFYFDLERDYFAFTLYWQ